jgi:hypothetical protein
MTGLLARPARETRNRRAEGAKASAAERRDEEGSGAAAGPGAASLGTVPAMVAPAGVASEVVGEAAAAGWSRGLLRCLAVSADTAPSPSYLPFVLIVK